MKKPHFSTKEILPLFFAILLEILGFGLAYPVLTALFTSTDSILPLSTSENLRYWYLGLGFMLYPFFMFFGSSFMGDLSDRIGRKKVILICMGGLAVGFGLMGLGVLLSSLLLLFFGRGLSGLMAASMAVVLSVISDLSSEESKTKHMSYLVFVQSIGFILGPLIGGILSDSKIFRFLNYSIPFFMTSFLAIIAFIWIYYSFEETFIRKREGKIDFFRIFKNYLDAAKDQKVRLLSIAFLFMQVAIALYIQLILIYFREAYLYSTAMLGIFNAYTGFWFGVGVIVILPILIRHFINEKIVILSLFITGISQLLSSIFPSDILLWIFAIPLSIALQAGFASFLATFSNAVSKAHQGWVMGIIGAIIALSFTITGLAPNLIPLFGVPLLIFFGSLLMIFSGLIMIIYHNSFIKNDPQI